MDVHIDKKVGALLIIAVILGGTIGFFVGGEEGHDRGDKTMEQSQYDNQKDGEVSDDQGVAPNSHQEKTPTAVNQSTSVQAPMSATSTPTVQKTN